MSSIPLPALSVRPPQDPSEGLGNAVRLASLLQAAPIQRQIMQQQAQAGALENQQRQQALNDQQAMTMAMKSWDGKDYDALSKSVLQNGGSANAAVQIMQHGLTIKKTVSDIAKQDAETGSKNLETFIGKQKAIGDALVGIESVPDDQLHNAVLGKINDLVKGNVFDPQTAQGLTQQVSRVQDPQQLRALVDQAGKAAAGASYAAEQEKTKAQTRKDTAEATKAEQESKFYQGLGLAPGVTPDMASYAAFLQKGGKPEGWTGYKAGQEASARQPYQIATSLAEVKAKQLMEGMAKPGYAFNPATGQTQLTDQTAYLQSGGRLQAFRPVTEKEVKDDTMLINRLGDVHQKVAEYEQALQQPVSAKEKSDMAGLLGEGAKGGAAAKVGFLGAGAVIPMDRLNAFMDSASLAELSPNARNQLIAYRNAREAMIGYKTVLSGSARGSDKSMELLEAMLPSPAVTDRDYSQRSLNSFRGNLRVVGQGLPTLPGIKSPQEIENEVRQGNGNNLPQINGQLSDLLNQMNKR